MHDDTPASNSAASNRSTTTGGAAVDAIGFEDSSTSWMMQGNCRLYPPATFFPSDGVGVDRARKICVGCPVLDACLEYALEHRIDHGVWGGCSERERRRILKRRRLALAAQ